MRGQRPTVGILMVVSAAGLFALNGTVSKLLLLGGFDPPQLTTFRATGAFVGLLLLCLFTPSSAGSRLRRLAIRRAELPRLVAFGLTGFFLVPLLYFVAISRLPVGIGLLFEYTGPLFVALWVRFGDHQQVKPRLWVGLLLCLLGLACVAELWTGSMNLDPVGVVAGLTCAVLLACYFVLGSRSVTVRDPLSVTWWAFGFAAVAGSLVRPWWRFPGGLLRGTSQGVPMWLLATYLVIFGSVAAYLLVTASLRHLPPTSVSIIGMSEPVLASMFAWALLGEVLSPAQIVGGLVVLTGLVLAETARTARPARTATPPGQHLPSPAGVGATPEIPPA